MTFELRRRASCPARSATPSWPGGWASRSASRAPLADVRDAVIELRRGKGMVLDPADPDSRSAGSFFTNPIVPADRAVDGCPSWPAGDGQVKLSAAWLVEHAGFGRGTRDGHVGTSSRHSLALTTEPGATATELLAFADRIVAAVQEQFGVTLGPRADRRPALVGRRARDLVLGGLGERADHQQVDVDVVRPGDRPGDAVGDVLGDQRLAHPAVDRVGRLGATPNRISANSSVRTMPGAISMTRTGWPLSSSRSVSASVCTPCLAAV